MSIYNIHHLIVHDYQSLDTFMDLPSFSQDILMSKLKKAQYKKNSDYVYTNKFKCVE